MLFEAELRSALLRAGGAAAAVCAALLLADIALSLLARVGYATRPAAALRRISPPLVRHAVEIVVTALVAVGAARPVGASPTPVRDWLRRSTSTTATTGAAVTTTTTRTGPAQPPATIPPGPTVTTTPATVPALPAPAAVPAHESTTVPARAPTPIGTPPAGDRYVVQPGDCLWRIAARRLGAGATNQAIDGAWRAIYAANRAAVGENPNLIHPGLVLTLPPLAAAH